MIQLKHLSKSFDHVVLDDINLTLEKGKIYVIKGISGCGKTTLLNILSGLDKVYDGEMYVNGVERKSMNNSQSYEYTNKIGYMMQKSLLFKNLTVSENLMFIEKNENKIKRYSELFKIAHLLHKKPDKLSGGERQRASLIRALLNNNEIIICDEPTSSLDKKNANAFVEYLNEIDKSNKIVIIASHKKIYDEIADEVIHLEYGKVKEIKKNKHENEIKEIKEEIINEKDLKDDFTFIKKNKKKTNVLVKLFLLFLFVFLFSTLSVKENYKKACIEKNLNDYPFDMLDFTEDAIERKKDIIEKVYDNYIVREKDFIAYGLFEKEDTTFKNPKFIKYGSFPEKENEVLVNEELAKLKFPDVKEKNVINKKIFINDEEYLIKGITKFDKKDNYNSIYSDNVYYSMIQMNPEIPAEPSVFIPYEKIKYIGEKQFTETKMVNIRKDNVYEIYENNLTVSDFDYGGRRYSICENRISILMTRVNFYVNICLAAFVVFGILAIIFISNQISLELYFRKKEIGYLQLFHLSKIEIGFIIISQYLLDILEMLVISIIIYIIGITYYKCSTGLNLMLSLPILLISVFLLALYCIGIVFIPLSRTLTKDIITLIRS